MFAALFSPCSAFVKQLVEDLDLFDLECKLGMFRVRLSFHCAFDWVFLLVLYVRIRPGERDAKIFIARKKLPFLRLSIDKTGNFCAKNYKGFIHEAEADLLILFLEHVLRYWRLLGNFHYRWSTQNRAEGWRAQPATRGSRDWTYTTVKWDWRGRLLGLIFRREKNADVHFTTITTGALHSP